MAIALAAVGALQIIAAFLVYQVSDTVIDEAVAVMLFGFGTLTIALAAILHRISAPPMQIATTTSPKGDLVTIYRMYDIRRDGAGVTAAGASFPNVDAAKAFIDQRSQANA